jgi:hypothetical protein
MDHIKSLLKGKNVFNILNKKEIIISIIEDVLSLKIKKEEISFLGDSIIIKTSTENKHLLLINKNKILLKIKNNKNISFYKKIV